MDIFFNRKKGITKAQALFDELRDGITSGRLHPGDQLPSSRSLADQLNISRHTVTTTYGRLTAEGYIRGEAGSGSFVANGWSTSPGAAVPGPLRAAIEINSPEIQRARPDTPYRFDLRSGRPDPALFPSEQWRRCVRSNLRSDPMEYQSPAGILPLRRALAQRVATHRGVEALPDQVVVTAGAQQAIDLACRLLVLPGEITAIEEPGYSPAAQLFASQGSKVHPVPVDENGLIIKLIPPEARLIYVSPSHQSPTGVTMSLERRRELLHFADIHGVAIVEDDYDSEYRYVDRPLEPLHRLDRTGRVIYVGTFSKILSPTLRLGFAVFPSSLAEDAARLRSLMGWQPPLFLQRALHQLLVDGHFDRHLRRSRKIYQARFQQVSNYVANAANRGVLRSGPPSHAGLHVMAYLPNRVSEQSIISRAADDGLALSHFADCWYGKNRREGLMIGFGAIATDDLPAALTTLDRALSLP